MLGSVHIENYQTHEDLEVEFSPTITTIIGASGEGKSTIVRALKWAMLNQPRGDGFIKHGAKSVKVTLNVDDNTIVRQRGGDNNLYQLNGQEFRAFGNDVPPDVAKALNVNHLNFQTQFDPPFWFSSSAGEVSRQLNEIVNLGLIDSSLASMDKILRKVRAEVEVLEGQQERTKQEGERLEWTRQAHKELRRVERLEKELDKTWSEATRLGNLVETIQSYQEDIKASTCLLSAGTIAIEKGEAWKEQEERLHMLSSQVDTIETLEEKASCPIPPSLEPLEAQAKQIQEIEKERERLAHVIDCLEDEESTICRRQKELESSSEWFDKKMGKTCLLCGAKLKTKS